MRTALIILMLVIPIPLAGVHATHGQAAAPLSSPTTPHTTGSPTPAPTSTPIPDGHALLTLMRKAITLRKTVRIDSTALSTWKGHWALGVTWMDMGIQSNTMREVDTWQRVKTAVSPLGIGVERRELLFAHEKAASRKPHGSWHCERLRGVAVTSSLIPFQMRVTHVTNLGPTEAGGVAVWHVQATGAEVPLWATRSATVDLSISRADYTLARLTLHTTVRLGGASVHESITEAYSRYGEPVKVRLPGPCL